MTAPALTGVPGLEWMENGQAVLWGPLLALADRLDQRFVGLARRWDAEELRFPAFIPAAALERVDWFRSFPQLATFPVSLEAAEANVRRFVDGEPVDADGSVRLGALAPVRDVLTPAACYHLYAHHHGARFHEVRHFTTRSTCFRREDHYLPLERQWSFTMREIVCMGTAGEAGRFLQEARAEVDALTAEMGLPVAWQLATDPFFQPSKNPRYLMQRIDPTKHELVFGGALAVASVNLHHDHFGRAFAIQRVDGDGGARPVHTACVAFGVERWLAAAVRHFGTDPADWPRVGLGPRAASAGGETEP